MADIIDTADMVDMNEMAVLASTPANWPTLNSEESAEVPALNYHAYRSVITLKEVFFRVDHLLLLRRLCPRLSFGFCGAEEVVTDGCCTCLGAGAPGRVWKRDSSPVIAVRDALDRVLMSIGIASGLARQLRHHRRVKMDARTHDGSMGCGGSSMLHSEF